MLLTDLPVEVLERIVAFVADMEPCERELEWTEEQKEVEQLAHEIAERLPEATMEEVAAAAELLPSPLKPHKTYKVSFLCFHASSEGFECCPQDALADIMRFVRRAGDKERMLEIHNALNAVPLEPFDIPPTTFITPLAALGLTSKLFHQLTAPSWWQEADFEACTNTHIRQWLDATVKYRAYVRTLWVRIELDEDEREGLVPIMYNPDGPEFEKTERTQLVQEVIEGCPNLFSIDIDITGPAKERKIGLLKAVHARADTLTELALASQTWFSQVSEDEVAAVIRGLPRLQIVQLQAMEISVDHPGALLRALTSLKDLVKLGKSS